jgi:hypothetical protein
VDQTNLVTVSREAEVLIRLVFGLVAVGVEEPVVVRILVVIAGDLLLLRTLWVGLMMGMKKTTAIAHVLQSHARAEGELQGTIFPDLGTTEIGLKERAHLRIARTAVLQDEEVKEEREHVYGDRDENQAKDAEAHVCSEFDLQLLAENLLRMERSIP